MFALVIKVPDEIFTVILWIIRLKINEQSKNLIADCDAIFWIKIVLIKRRYV